MGFLENYAVKRWMKALTKAKTHHDRLKYRLKLLGLKGKLGLYMETYIVSPEIEFRKAAVGVVKETHTVTAKKMLLDRLKNDSSDAVRYKAAEALAKFKGDDTVETLIGALSDKSDKVRLCACVALKTLLGKQPGGQDSRQASMTGGNLMVDSDQLERQVSAWLEWWQEEHKMV